MKREDALLKFKKQLDKADITFILGHGTCLGAYRDNALIEDDHDIDISFLSGDPESIKKITKYKYNIRHSKLDQFTFNVEGYKFDLCFWKKNENVYNLNFRDDYRDPDVLPAKFAETKEIKFLGEMFLIPKHTEEYLEYFYGKTWKTRIKGKQATIKM